MGQERNLIPTSVYLDPGHVDEADGRAADLGVARATLMRMILTGKQAPLGLATAEFKKWRAG